MRKFLKILLFIGLLLFVALSTFSFFYINSIVKEVKDVPFDKDKLLASTSPMLVYDSGDNLLTSSNAIGHNMIKIDDLNDHTIAAFVSIEDKDFYRHKGLNYKRIAKAMLNNIKSMSFKEGASTISQQLIKNTHLSSDKTIRRKIKEMILTKKLEKTFDKDEIMEMYLNVIYFGDRCYGIEEASLHYFGKNAKDLTVDESAVLAGIIKSPYTYSPVHNYDKCIERRNLVLRQMEADGYIDNYDYMKELPIPLNISEKESTSYDIYTQSAINEACKILQISEREFGLNGYKIYTYQKEDVQNNLVKTFDENEIPLNDNGNACERLAIVINNDTGGIEGFYSDSKYSLIDIKRQPGSAIKPIMVYSPALDEGMIYNCSVILDEKIDIDGYSPNNVGNKFYGYVSIKDCVAKSLNVPAVKLMNCLGVKNCKEYAERFGIEFSEKDTGLSLALGGFTDGITLQTLTNAFVPYSNNGQMIKSGFVREIRTRDDIVVYRKNENKKQIMDEDIAYLTHDLLKYGVKNGTSGRLKNLDFEIGGKTGTVAVKGTNQNTDALSIAYTSAHTMGVWYGNYTYNTEDNLEGSNNGGTYATSIIRDTFKKLYDNNKPNDIEKPNSIVEKSIDIKAIEEENVVKLADNNTPLRYVSREIFSVNHVPNETSTTFSDIGLIDFDIVNSDSYCTISFEAKDYVLYDIMCNGRLICTIENKNGHVEYKHENLLPNTMYSYCIDSYTLINGVEKSSPTKSIITKNVYEKLLDDLDNDDKYNETLSWYFY